VDSKLLLEAQSTLTRASIFETCSCQEAARTS